MSASRWRGWLAAALLGSLLPLHAAQPPAAPVRSVGAVDLQRYAGRWHELARYPNRFQAHCVAEVSADYRLRDDGRIDVINSCRLADGRIDRADGVAYSLTSSNDQLKARFAPAWLALLPAVWGDYWILGLAPDYRYALVGDPQRRYLWVLARDTRLDEADWASIRALVVAQGFALERLQLTAQGAAD